MKIKLKYCDNVTIKIEKGNYKTMKNNPDNEKKLEALKIMKEKDVNIGWIKYCKTYEQYTKVYSCWNPITEKEFYLIRDVLL